MFAPQHQLLKVSLLLEWLLAVRGPKAYTALALRAPVSTPPLDRTRAAGPSVFIIKVPTVWKVWGPLWLTIGPSIVISP